MSHLNPLRRAMTLCLAPAAALALSLLILSGCPSPVAPRPGTFADTYSGGAPAVFHVPASGGYTFTYSLDLGSATKNVYFIFTNTSTSSAVPNPTVRSLSAARQLASPTVTAAPSPRVAAASTGLAMRGMPEISAFNENPSAYIPAQPVARSLVPAPPAPLLDIAGSSVMNFKTDYISPYGPVAATCRKVVDLSLPDSIPRTLNIWVADDCWSPGGTQSYLVTQAMVDNLAAKFLAAGAGNDIYDWVTGIFGPEWGEVPGIYSSTLIAPDDQITILLFDIQGDDDVFVSDGGVVGFFWAKDNFGNTEDITYSNERVMFYVDAVMLAYPDGSWDITDTWPSEVVATLAHEFQHMVNFYQKSVLRTTNLSGTQTWINEMLSMCTEDILADKIGVDGPRGVSYSEYTAGAQGNPYGRLPLFNYCNDYQVAYWPLDPFAPTSLLSYSINYALGAYLTRNYTGAAGGSAAFLRNVVQNGYTDYRALESAVGLAGSADSFGVMLQKWGAAVLVSDDIAPSAGYGYNTGTSVDSTLDSVTYRLGSINLYNYRYYETYPVDYLDGPWIYTASPVGLFPTHLGTSNLFYRAGEGRTGVQQWDVYMGTGVKLTVVVRDPPA